MRLSKAARTTKANSLLTTKNSGTIEIYTGSPPPTVDAALGTQVLLVTFNIPVTAGTILNGIFTAAAIADAAAVAGGTASWYRQIDPDGTTIMGDGNVTISGGGGDMIIDNVNIANTQNVRFISWTETEGNPD